MGNQIRRNVRPRHPSTFTVGITSNEDYFDMNAVGHTIKSGYHTIFKVQAMEISPSHSLRSIPYERRGCKFENEIEGLQLFKFYSQSACEIEKKINESEEFCQCIPWYFPSKFAKVWKYELPSITKEESSTDNA